MNRIPPSERIQKQIDALLEGERANGDELVTKLTILGAQHLGQEMLEQEVTDYLGRGHYERREESNENCGYRNGYRPARMDTAEGRVQLQVPQVRESAEPYRSRLVDFLRGTSIFRFFALPKPYTSTKDIFCMRERCMVNGYRRISLFKYQIQAPNVPLYEEVDVRIVHNTKKPAM
jgi:hypothetical protein